ncbi:SDR family NAD(P)-dependent oxidoreductase [Streptomyces sp. NBC_01387]|uniref:SDR family NAD(P)-dependent oxidoreductase n=1 Tax=unclassified Streptomyces TaxID=2593676 RepID=UPI0020247702|nr:MULTISPECIES: SDR family NAD(P)-dependent oxidoreductase [unclassified Streptomyces]MCX4551895.1 SDR family NAD(P)-dependent oxidoreductase [Streptomyces sp. NBC_01500]WSC23258.1 SDR family NAD(P)-dependent oxidoreductase [Streptomyces sp. NBC_01766]WSV57169.1 SDR family NAD(P)-dependent oxidoreductase [Streptomyces sp. NBC_01014]
MRLEPGRVAVVTGAASGIGLAMARKFAAGGLKVVLADVEAAALDSAAEELRAEGAQVLARVVDVGERDEVLALADAVYGTFGAVHVLCNNAGVGSGAEGRMWEHDPNDWKWAFAVNVWGVFHGIQAFVPKMIASGEPGHVVNTSSGDGGIAPLPTASVYAVTKSAVVTMTESLYAHLRAEGVRVGASVLFPGPHMLRTGLWESHRNRPERYAKERPRRTPYRSLDQWESAMKDSGQEVRFTPVEEVAELVAEGIEAERFWLLPESEHSDLQIRRRAQSMLDRAAPSYLENFVLD